MDANLPLMDVTNGGDSAMPARKRPEKKSKKTFWTQTHTLVLKFACGFKFEMPKEWVPEDWDIQTNVMSILTN